MRAFFYIKIIFILLILSGCGPKTKEHLLRTFFDGVPTQEESVTEKNQAQESVAAEKKTDEQSLAQKTQQAPTFYRHLPYAEGACDSCHTSQSSQKLQAEGKELCFSCHEDFLEGAEVQHYPAQEGMCGECHNPHRSPNKFMLNKPVQALCFDCHDKNDLFKVSPHDTLTDEDDCTLCHNPHAGGKFLLE